MVWEDGGRETPSYPINPHPLLSSFFPLFSGAGGVLPAAGYAEAGHPLAVRGVAHLRVPASFSYHGREYVNCRGSPFWDLLYTLIAPRRPAFSPVSVSVPVDYHRRCGALRLAAEVRRWEAVQRTRNPRGCPSS